MCVGFVCNAPKATRSLLKRSASELSFLRFLAVVLSTTWKVQRSMAQSFPIDLCLLESCAASGSEQCCWVTDFKVLLGISSGTLTAKVKVNSCLHEASTSRRVKCTLTGASNTFNECLLACFDFECACVGSLEVLAPKRAQPTHYSQWRQISVSYASMYSKETWCAGFFDGAHAGVRETRTTKICLFRNQEAIIYIYMYICFHIPYTL